jgi:hypothetical protein
MALFFGIVKLVARHSKRICPRYQYLYHQRCAKLPCAGAASRKRVCLSSEHLSINPTAPAAR